MVSNRCDITGTKVSNWPFLDVFRGICEATGEWVYGNYYMKPSNIGGESKMRVCIQEFVTERDAASYYVDRFAKESSVGRCTGLDANKSYRGPMF